MAKHAAEGEEVISVTFSSGEKGVLTETDSTVIKKRKEETIAADKILGCKATHFFNLPDAQLSKYLIKKKYINRVAELLKKYHPKAVFTHCIDDPHSDHRAVAQLVKNLSTEFPETVFYSFTIASPMRLIGRNNPRIYIDVSEHYDKKLAAAKEFKSQRVWLYYYLTLTRILNKLAGWKIDAEYAEMFYSM